MKIIKLNAIDSTNAYLKRESKNEFPYDEVIVTAAQQTQGRGQMGSVWQSKIGQSLTCSVFKRFKNVPVSKQAYLSFAISLGIKEGLGHFKVPGFSIKWPNDILSYSKKIGGILIENQLQKAHIVASVIGIGININETEFATLPQASSLCLTTGIKYEIEEVLFFVAEAIFKQLIRLEHGEYELLKTEYEATLFKKDVPSLFEKNSGERFTGIIKGVTTNGELIVETENGNTQNFQLKEIKLVY